MFRLDRYILQELFGPFLFGIAAFTAILAGSTALFQLVGQAVQYNIPLPLIVELFVYRLPSIIVFTFPMSILLASILAFGRLSSDLEIIAFRASGISIYRLIVPVFIAGLTISLATIWFNESIVPRASHSAEELFISLTEKGAHAPKKNINHTEYGLDGSPTRIIHVGRIQDQSLEDITVIEFEKGMLNRLIRAHLGQWNPPNNWVFFDGTMHIFPEQDIDKILYVHFLQETLSIPFNPKDLTKREKTVEEMNAAELYGRISEKKKSGLSVADDMVKYHLKFSVPFASLIFAILGACVGLRPHRSSSAMGLGMSLIIIIVYYVLLSLGMGLGMSAILPAVFAEWIPNAVVGFAAFYLLYKIAYQ